MSGTLETIERRLSSAGELHDIVGAMRSMAAIRLQEASAALPATRAYADTIATALAEVLALQAPVTRPRPRAPLLVVFTPEHGFVGALPERLLQAARGHGGHAGLVLVGDRGADLAAQHELAVDAHLALGAHASTSAGLARRLTTTLSELTASRHADGVDVLYPRHQPSGEPALIIHRLLPVDREALPAVDREPLLNLPVQALTERLIAEWLLGELAHAAVETLASENSARLLTTDTARHNIESRLDDLRRAYRAARQDSITEEIAEVAGGVLAQEG